MLSPFACNKQMHITLVSAIVRYCTLNCHISNATLARKRTAHWTTDIKCPTIIPQLHGFAHPQHHAFNKTFSPILLQLITSVHPSCLRLTPYDDQIYQTFRQDFPDLKVDILSDDILKSPEAKLAWRNFAEKFNKLEDYSYGTLMRYV